MTFKSVYRAKKMCYYHRHSGFGTIKCQRLSFCDKTRNKIRIQNVKFLKSATDLPQEHN